MSLRFDERGGRVIRACIAPFLDETATVNDGTGPYREKLRPGIFRQQIQDAENGRPLRVWLNIAHDSNVVVGHAVRLRELSTAVYGDFMVHDGPGGDEVLAAVRDGLKSMSVGMTSLRSRDIGGITHRQTAHLTDVALVNKGAYATAEIFGIRRTIRGDQPAPATSTDFFLWDIERIDAKWRALELHYIDEALERRAKYTDDRRYQLVTKHRHSLAATRAELEAEIATRVAASEAPEPQVVHRLLSGPEGALRPGVVRRDCAEILAIR